MWLFLTIVTGLCADAAERSLVHPPVAEVWKLDSTASVGGHTPEDIRSAEDHRHSGGRAGLGV